MVETYYDDPVKPEKSFGTSAFQSDQAKKKLSEEAADSSAPLKSNSTGGSGDAWSGANASAQAKSDLIGGKGEENPFSGATASAQSETKLFSRTSATARSESNSSTGSSGGGGGGEKDANSSANASSYAKSNSTSGTGEFKDRSNASSDRQASEVASNPGAAVRDIFQRVSQDFPSTPQGGGGRGWRTEGQQNNPFAGAEPSASSASVKTKTADTTGESKDFSRTGGGRPMMPAQGPENQAFVDAREPVKPARLTDPQSKDFSTPSTGRPAWLAQGQENNALFDDKEPVKQVKGTDRQPKSTGEKPAVRAAGTAPDAFDDSKVIANKKSAAVGGGNEKSTTGVALSAAPEARQAGTTESWQTTSKRQAEQTAEMRSQSARIQEPSKSEPSTISHGQARTLELSSNAQLKSASARVNDGSGPVTPIRESVAVAQNSGAEQLRPNEPVAARSGPESRLYGRVAQVAGEFERPATTGAKSEGQARGNVHTAAGDEQAAKRVTSIEAPVRAQAKEQPVLDHADGFGSRPGTDGHTKNQRLPHLQNESLSLPARESALSNEKTQNRGAAGDNKNAQTATDVIDDARKQAYGSARVVNALKSVIDAAKIEPPMLLRREALFDASVPSRMVQTRDIVDARAALIGVLAVQLQRKNELPLAVPNKESRTTESRPGTKSDTMPVRGTIAAHDATQGKSKASPVVDAVRSGMPTVPTRVDVPIYVPTSPTRVDLPARVAIIPVVGTDGSRSVTVKDARGVSSGKSHTITDKRYITGTEIALAAVIAAAGAARVRADGATGKAGAALGVDQTILAQGKPFAESRTPRKDSQMQPAVSAIPDKVVQPAKSWSIDGRLPATMTVTNEQNTSAQGKTSTGMEAGRIVTAPESKSQGELGQSKVPVDGRVPVGEQTSLVAPGIVHDENETGKPANDGPLSNSALVGPDAPGQTAQLREFLPALEIVELDEPLQKRIESYKALNNEQMELTTFNMETALKEVPSAPRVMQRPTVLISASDTLVGIAESLFHDPKIAWLIADLNQSRIKERVVDGKRVVELRSRQQIELPVWDDIVVFYRQNGYDVNPDNLVTVVEETSLDTELLQSTLGTVMGGGNSSLSPLCQSVLMRNAASESAHSSCKNWNR